MGTVNHMDCGTPARFPGTKRQSRTVDKAALSRRKNPLEFLICASCARPVSLTRTRISTVPCSPRRPLIGG